jgi:tetratricopeptide (TPR) repeat protein
MATTGQLREEQTGTTAPASVFAQRAMAQYLACLVKAGDSKALETLSAAGLASVQEPVLRYSLAVALASAGKIDEAIGLLRALATEKTAFADGRKLAYRLLYRKAQTMASSQDWAGLADVVTEALTLLPSDANTELELGVFRNALPIGHLRSGNRQEAARIWEQQFRQNPTDMRLVHHLALLYYWWARSLPVTEAVPQWNAAIAYWSVLAQRESFWVQWGAERCSAWGFDFPAGDIDDVRKHVIEDQLNHFFQTRADEHMQKGEVDSARCYEDSITASMLESRSAACWKSALALMPADPARPVVLNLPGGYAFFKRFDLLPEILLSLERIPDTSEGKKLRIDLRILFSEAGLGTALALAEERNRPEEAIRHLDPIWRANRQSTEVEYVWAVALARKGIDLDKRGETARALGEWKKAYDLARKNKAEGAKEFDAPLQALLDSVRQQHVAAVKKESSRLKNEEKLEEAIAFIENFRQMDHEESLLEIQCIYLCDRAVDFMGARDFLAARERLNRVLKLKPKYARAMQLISVTYNNEGCKEDNSDRAIALFEKAMEWNSGDHMARQNLAQELKRKSVAIFNALTQANRRTGCEEPIRLLERAAGLYGNDLKPDALKTIEQASRFETDGIEKAINGNPSLDDTLKRILVDLAVMYNSRYRARGY